MENTMSNRRPSYANAALSGLLLLACAACEGPKATVEYGLNKGPDPEGLIKFKLAKSAIMVDYAKTADGKATDTSKISLVSVPQEHGGTTYTIGETSNLLAATHLKVTKRENTDLLQSIGTDVEDKRVELIQQVGAFAGAVIGGMAFFAAKTEPSAPVLPYAIDISTVLNTAQPGEFDSPGTVGGKWSYTLAIGPAPRDAYATTDYVARFGTGVRSNVLFYSACRDATVTFTSGPFTGKVFPLRISDPNFVQTIGMPAKGSVTFHTACGVNVTGERANVASTLEVLNALMNQAKTLIESTKKK